METGSSGVQRHPQLHSKFKASLGYSRACQNKQANKLGRKQSTWMFSLQTSHKLHTYIMGCTILDSKNHFDARQGPPQSLQLMPPSASCHVCLFVHFLVLPTTRLVPIFDTVTNTRCACSKADRLVLDFIVAVLFYTNKHSLFILEMVVAVELITSSITSFLL